MEYTQYEGAIGIPSRESVFPLNLTINYVSISSWFSFVNARRRGLVLVLEGTSLLIFLKVRVWGYSFLKIQISL